MAVGAKQGERRHHESRSLGPDMREEIRVPEPTSLFGKLDLWVEIDRHYAATQVSLEAHAVPSGEPDCRERSRHEASGP